MDLLIIDDHPLFLEGMKYLTEQLADDAKVHVARSGSEAIEAVGGRASFALILLDLRMPGEDGFATMAGLLRLAPGTPVAMLSASEDRADMERALREGARGYIPKTTEPNVMLHALRLILEGGVYVPPHLIGYGESVDAPAPRQQQTSYALSERQRTILRYLAEGRSNKFIAYELNVTETTVKGHITGILRSLNVRNRTQAALLAQRENLIDAG